MIRKALLLLIAALSLATVAFARDRRPGDPRPSFDPECAATCREGFRSCASAGRTERRACVEMCSAQIEAVHAACDGIEPGQEPSAECKAARELAHACIKPCREAYRDDRGECGTTVRSCLDACIVTPPAEPSPRPTRSPEDRGCIGECRHDNRQCLRQAQRSGEACRALCSAEEQAVIASCGRRPNGNCRAALAALGTCLEPCRDSTRAAIESCATAASGCVEACDAATPTP